MSGLDEVGTRDGWRCWICDEAVDPHKSVNDARGPSIDSYFTASKAGKAKDLLGQGEEKASAAAGEAAAGNTEAAAANASQSAGLIDKAKELLTDERIDQVAGAIKGKTPDNVDAIVDQVAAKGKEFNN